jgi:MinD-like ATPase involved in chromosome partitioning or flagellar assembly
MGDSANKVSKPAWVLTFYSYKGGVGRTLALSNIARYLSEELGYRVGLIDLDTESPGLANEPLCGDLDPERAVERGRILKTIREQPGFTELFIKIYHHVKDSSNDFGALLKALPNSEAISELKDLSDFWKHKSIFDYAVPLPVDGNGGVFLMTAGRRAGDGQSLERRDFRTFNHIISQEENDNLLPVLTSALLRKFIDSLHLDFVFIDGRTGLTPFFHVYVYTIPHALVLFMGLNEQNVSGSLNVLKNAMSDTEVVPAPVFLVASPVPNVNPEQLERRLDSIDKILAQIRPGNGQYSFYSLPRTVDYFLPYVDLASYQETYFIKKYPHSSLSREYVRLAHSIEGLVASSGPGERPQRPRTLDESKKVWSHAVEEIPPPAAREFNIAAEDIIQEKLSEFLTRRLGCEDRDWKKGGPDNRFGTREFAMKMRDDEEPFALRLHLWNATEAKAPWGRLVRQSGEAVERATKNDNFDIVILPQSFVGGLDDEQVWRFDAIRREFDDLSSRFSILSYEFLDRWYPGWRRLCGNRLGIAGLPFSANTTLLCANRSLLGQLCDEYWERQKFLNARSTGRSLFFPSSWSLLRDLLDNVDTKRQDWDAFALAEKDRGLYYEWMNVVLAQGGGDLEVVEGDVVTDILLRDNPATEEGTKLFLDLALRAIPDKNRDMLKVQHLYAKGKLALYVAWSDSFRFGHDKCQLSSESADPSVAEDHYQQSSNKIEMQLGMVPRDMRYSRRPLVAGWLMVFPRHGGGKIREERYRLKLILTFAELFLDSSAQEELLRSGFPSACLPVIENQIRLTSEHHRRSDHDGDSNLFLDNYQVFLKSQRAALTSGHWVPSVLNSSKITELIGKSLAKAVDKVRKGGANGSSLEEVFPEKFMRHIFELIEDGRGNGRRH